MATSTLISLPTSTSTRITTSTFLRSISRIIVLLHQLSCCWNGHCHQKQTDYQWNLSQT